MLLYTYKPTIIRTGALKLRWDVWQSFGPKASGYSTTYFRKLWFLATIIEQVQEC